MAKANITATRLKELFAYDPDTGVFTRLVATHKFSKGSVAGHIGAYGYWCIGIDKKKYLAHRLAVLFMTESISDLDVDHINGNRLDNRWLNLRQVTRSVNLQNKRKPRKDNKSGFLGVHRANGDGNWRAVVCLNGNSYDAGCHKTPELAHEAYIKLKRQLHEGCTI